jgi:hypothetical protein
MTSLQNAGKHEEALAIARHVLAELPAVGQQHRFRKFVTKSENALGSGESILPPTGFSFKDLIDWRSDRYSPGVRWATAIAVCAVLLAAGLGFQNEYRRRHRTIEVINGLGKPVQISIDGGAPVEIQEVGKLAVVEGAHRIKVTGAVEEEWDIDMNAGYFQRWTHSPLWILNPGGAAAFEYSVLHYAVDPRPTESRLLVGERFIAIPHVDFEFETPPAQLKLDSRTSKVVKHAFQRVTDPPQETFRLALNSDDPVSALNFAEAQIARNPNNTELASTYVSAAVQLDQGDRARAFLKNQAARRPVAVPVHRAYQSLEQFAQQDAALEAEYAALLAKDPSNAVLMYLLGRVTMDPKASHDLFAKATQTDPAFPWAWYALASADACRGEWQSCLALLAKISNSVETMAEADDFLKLGRLATGQAALVEAESRQKLAQALSPQSVAQLLDLVDALIVQDQSQAARDALAQFETKLPIDLRTNANLALLRSEVWYRLGDFAAITSAHNANDASPPPILLQALLATGEYGAVAEHPELRQTPADPYATMGLSIACEAAGNFPDAQFWRDKAADGLSKSSIDYRRAADILRSNDQPKLEDIAPLVIETRMKCLLVTLLALRFPQQRGELAPMAMRLNVSRQPPYHLVQKVLK